VFRYISSILFLISFIFSQPVIDSIEPAFGSIGSTITIRGNNFSSNFIDNTVFFNGLESNILNATENELMVSVPYGVYYTPISVYTNGLYTISNQRFNVTFNATEELTVAHLSNQLDNPYLGRKYYDAKIADLNGDEIPEIITSEAGYYSSAYLAIFTTSFDDEGMISIDEHIEFNFGTGVYSSPDDIALGDLNGDGLLDIVASENGDITDDFESHSCIFINTSHHQNFSFDSPIIIEGDGYEAGAQLRDINGDGKLDIVTIRGSAWSIMNVYINTSDGDNISFEDKLIVPNVLASEIDFADLNGDGMIDMVTTSYASSSSSREVFVYSNNSRDGNIEFNLEATILSGGEPPDGPADYNWSASSLKLTDIDGDGRLDIVVANGTCSLGCSPSGISIIRNTSTASELSFEYNYSNFYQYQSQTLPSGINISDLNGDGKPDVLTNDWMGGISIMVNLSIEGNIALEEQMILGIGSFPLSIATADLNMDSTPEIVVSNWEVEGLRVIHNFLPVTQSPSDIEITVTHQSDWNLVGLPVEVEDASYSNLFPESINGTLYSFGVGYNLEASLIQGEGYWLRFNEEGSTTISGAPINELTISLNEGWNLLSGISTSSDITEIQDPDGIIISGTIYGFTSGGYSNAEILESGKGYWFRANSSGSITLIDN